MGAGVRLAGLRGGAPGGEVGGDARGFEVGDLPEAAGEPLVDASVAELAVEGFAVGGAFELCAGGDDGDLADELDFEVGGFEAGDDEAACAHVVELLGLVPLLFEGLDLVVHEVLVLADVRDALGTVGRRGLLAPDRLHGSKQQEC